MQWPSQTAQSHERASLFHRPRSAHEKLQPCLWTWTHGDQSISCWWVSMWFPNQIMSFNMPMDLWPVWTVKIILSQWMVMFDHTHRGSCGRAVNRSFSPGMVWVSLQILQSLVGLGTLNPFPPSPLFTGLCLTLCGMLLYRDLSPTRSMLWGGGGGMYVGAYW